MTNPVLVEIYRGKTLESFHRGVVCVVDKNGGIIYAEGDPMQISYPRSAMKLLQVLPLIEAGGIEAFGLTSPEIAMMCGSHNAEPMHLEIIRSILKKTGTSDSDLLCGPQYPSSKKDANELVIKGEKPQPIHNNCSGKHAGMLALCRLMNEDIQNYTDPSHPVQALIKQACSEMYEVEPENMETALDGCSAPIFSVTVYNQAIAYKNLVHPVQFGKKRQEACAIVIDAVSRHPFLVAGTKRYCTDLMKITAPRIIGKTGAEGIFCMGLTEELAGVCIKIDDGKMLPQYNVAQAFVEASGIFDAETLQPLHHYMNDDIQNFNKLVTGVIKVREGLFEGLKLS